MPSQDSLHTKHHVKEITFGSDARKSAVGGLRTTQAKTSLRIRAV